MKRLKLLRRDRKETQQQVAEALGVDRTTYAKYETGANEPNIATIRQLAAYYDVSIDYLLGNTDAPNAQSELAGFAVTGDVSLADLSPEEKDELRDFAKYLLSKRTQK